MVGYSSTLLSRTEVARDTMAFYFQKPPGFQFKAGQYIDLTLLYWAPNQNCQTG
jgi:ferredoxin-NADP reductase